MTKITAIPPTSQGRSRIALSTLLPVADALQKNVVTSPASGAWTAALRPESSIQRIGRCH